MMEIEILTECHDEAVVAVIVATIQEVFSSNGEKVELARVIRDKVNVPIWNFEARLNNLM